jgi:hypothetical protein
VRIRAFRTATAAAHPELLVDLAHGGRQRDAGGGERENGGGTQWRVAENVERVMEEHSDWSPGGAGPHR